MKLRPMNRVTVAGLVLLAVANVAQYLIRTRSGWSESAVDGASGLLMGVAIGVLLLGLWLARKSTL